MDIDLSGMKILVVEDSFLVADVLCEALREYGCEVVGPAPSVTRGTDLVEARSAEGGGGLTGALLDINLGGDTSFAVAAKLRERGVPFIFLTGYGEQTTLPGEFAGTRCVSKPCDIDELAEIIRTVF
jgi:DNA-binding response OmpR family regulator